MLNHRDQYMSTTSLVEGSAALMEFTQLTVLYKMISEEHLFLTVDAAGKFIELADQSNKAKLAG
jgi:hypothetical protein